MTDREKQLERRVEELERKVEAISEQLSDLQGALMMEDFSMAASALSPHVPYDSDQ